MSHQLPRRSIGAALIVVLLHLAVVTSGLACRFSMQGSTTMGTMVMGAVAGTQMGDSAQVPVLPAKSAPANAPCRLPWAPVGCQTMAQCAPAAIHCEGIIYSMPPVTAAGSRVVNVAAPESLMRAPEPPPPRA